MKKWTSPEIKSLEVKRTATGKCCFYNKKRNCFMWGITKPFDGDWEQCTKPPQGAEEIVSES